MKILHSADWHLGKRLDHFSRMEEQKAVMHEIAIVADREQPDLVILAGDLFDTFNPPIEAEELFYKSLREISDFGRRPVVALAGNHDSPDRINAPDPLARELGIFFAGYPDMQIADVNSNASFSVLRSEPGFVEFSFKKHDFPLRLIFTPYANEFRLKSYLGKEDRESSMRELLQQKWQDLADKYCDAEGVNLLAAHLFVMKEGQKAPEEPDDEKPVLHVGGAQAVYSSNIPEQIQYTALGHLHRRHHVDSGEKNIWYSGSPLSYSFSEADQDKFINMVNLKPGGVAEVEPIKLMKGKRLIRKRFEQIDQAISWLKNNPEVLVELTIVADDFLKSSERKALYDAHPGIITIIPEVKNKVRNTDHKQINLQQNTTALFEQYFEHYYKQAPNQELMDLFMEIKAEKDKA